MSAPLRVERTGPEGVVVRVVLDRPERHNAFDAEVIGALVGRSIAWARSQPTDCGRSS